MKKPKRKSASTGTLQARLTELEERAAENNIHVHYDMLEAAGLKLKDGMCKVNGEVHIFIDKRKPNSEKIDIFEHCLDRILQKDTT